MHSAHCTVYSVPTPHTLLIYLKIIALLFAIVSWWLTECFCRFSCIFFASVVIVVGGGEDCIKCDTQERSSLLFGVKLVETYCIIIISGWAWIALSSKLANSMRFEVLNWYQIPCWQWRTEIQWMNFLIQNIVLRFSTGFGRYWFNGNWIDVFHQKI